MDRGIKRRQRRHFTDAICAKLLFSYNICQQLYDRHLWTAAAIGVRAVFLHWTLVLFLLWLQKVCAVGQTAVLAIFVYI